MTLDQCLNIPLAEALVLIDGPDTAHIPQHLDHDNDIRMCEIDAVCNIVGTHEATRGISTSRERDVCERMRGSTRYVRGWSAKAGAKAAVAAVRIESVSARHSTRTGTRRWT